MSLEIEIGLQRLLMPMLLSLAGCYLLATTDQGEDWYDDEPVKGIGLRTLFGALLCAVAFVASDFWKRELILKPLEWYQWKASYQWHWMVWMIPASILVFAAARWLFSTPVHFPGVAWVVTGTLAASVLYVCLNEGAAWSDQSEKLLPWMAIGTVAILWNVMSCNAIARSGGSRWNPLVIVGQLGCIAAVAINAYASLSEWVLAGVGVGLGASVAALIKGSSSQLHFGWQLSTVVVPLAILGVCSYAVSDFFEAQPLPFWMKGLILFLPSAVGLVDFLIGRLLNQWVRAVLAALVCGGVLGIILFMTQSPGSDW